MQHIYSILWGIVINVYSFDRTLTSLFNIQSHFTHFEVKKFTLGDWLWGCQWAGVKAGGKVKEMSSLCQTLEPHIPHTTEPMEMLCSRVTDGTLPCCSAESCIPPVTLKLPLGYWNLQFLHGSQ